MSEKRRERRDARGGDAVGETFDSRFARARAREKKRMKTQFFSPPTRDDVDPSPFLPRRGETGPSGVTVSRRVNGRHPTASVRASRVALAIVSIAPRESERKSGNVTVPPHAPWYSWTISNPSPVARHDRTDSSTDPVSSRSSPSLDLHHATAHAPSSCASTWCARGESFIAETSGRARVPCRDLCAARNAFASLHTRARNFSPGDELTSTRVERSRRGQKKTR